jgi:hypothetical protein
MAGGEFIFLSCHIRHLLQHQTNVDQCFADQKSSDTAIVGKLEAQEKLP